MKNKVLRKLNFSDLLDYPVEVKPQHSYESPIFCKGYCVECETSGTLARSGGKLTLMSHGCDISDFEDVLGQKINNGAAVKIPIMFLMDDPGADRELGHEVSFNGFSKKPPVNEYYFAPSAKSWPQSIEDVETNGNYYGTYFAYIMQKHSLDDVYITNLVKCKRIDVEQPYLIEETCVNRFLEKEIKEYSPNIVFCFSVKVFNAFSSRFPEINSLNLYHPSFIQNFSQTKGMSRSDAMSENDRRIEEKLNHLV